MHLPLLHAPARSEAPEPLPASPIPAKAPGSADAFFATCMDHALAHSQSPNASAKEGRGGKLLAALPPARVDDGEQQQEPAAARQPATQSLALAPHLGPSPEHDPVATPQPAAQGKPSQATPEKKDPEDKKEEEAASFAQLISAGPTPPAVLETIALPWLVAAPAPVVPPPVAPVAAAPGGKALEGTDLTEAAAREGAGPSDLAVADGRSLAGMGLQSVAGMAWTGGSSSPVLALPMPTPAAEKSGNSNGPAQALPTSPAVAGKPADASSLELAVQALQKTPEEVSTDNSGSLAGSAQATPTGSPQAAAGEDSSQALASPGEASPLGGRLPRTAAEVGALAVEATHHGPSGMHQMQMPAARGGLGQIPAAHGGPSVEPGAGAEAVGTAAAQQPEPMQKTEPMLKSADRAQQKLPGAVVGPEGRQDLTGPAVSAERLASVVFPSVPEAGAATAASTPLVVTDARLQSLERTQDLVALHAVRLRESGAESLRVLLEPGAGLNLSLELRWREGAIEAQATLHRGDYNYLNQHWAELQQRLEPRGVHLASLESAVASDSGSGHFGQSRRPYTPEDSGASAFADFAFSDSMTDSPAARRSRALPAPRGWETWA